MIINEKNGRIIASIGKVLKKGNEYAIIHYLSDTESPNDWKEISEKEYQDILEKENEDNQNPNIEN